MTWSDQQTCNVISLDVEMPSERTEAHIGVVDWNGNVFLNEITWDLEDMKVELFKFIHPNTIIIGHAVHNDLRTLKIAHSNIIDTAEVFRTNSYAQAPSLKNLAEERLDRLIHRGNGRHNPIIDAEVCIDLMKSKVHESSNPLSGLSTGWKIGLGLFAGALAVGTAALAANE